MNTFDPDAFVNSQVEDNLSTEYPKLEEGEYHAVIEKVEAKNIEIKRGERAGEMMPLLEVQYKVSDEMNDGRVQQSVGRSEHTVTAGFPLDITESGTLATGKGKNIRLGRLRDAVAQNKPGQPWAPSHLIGNPVLINVKHDLQGDAVYERVTGWAPAQ